MFNPAHLGCCLLWLLLVPLAAARPPAMLPGTITSSGSDTLANMMTLWAADFTRNYPDADIQIQAAGSATAATALAVGTAQIGPMSRVMTGPEIAAFRRHYGYAPVAIPVALDALVIVVNQDNPLPSLTLRQLDAIFSSTRNCSETTPIARWDELGLAGGWRGRVLLRYGRNSASGTYGFFRQRVLCAGDMLPSVNELPGSASVAQAVAASSNAIGYASLGFRTAGVRIVPLADGQGHVVMPDEATLRDGEYPLMRYLYLYINKAPNKPMEPLITAFMDQILSPQGQSRTRQGGYLPLPEVIRLQARREIGLD